MKKKVIIIALLLAALLISPCSAWLSGYTYRQMHNITGDSVWNNNLSYYQVKFLIYNTTGISFNSTVYTNGHTQPTWDDIRFASLSDIEYAYWIESVGATYAVAWVNIPEIANSSTTNTSLYFYYGNPIATNNENGDNTFIFFDHFDNPSGALNTTKWVPSGAITVSNSICTLTSGGGVISSTVNTTTYPKFPVDRSLRSYLKSQHITASYDERLRFDNSSNFYGAIAEYSDSGGENYKYRNVNGGTTTSAIFGWLANTYQISDISRFTTSCNYSVNDANQVVITNSVYSGTVNAWLYVNRANARIDCDWLLVRNITPYPPLNLWWGDEEFAYYFIQWDKESYASGEMATVNTSFPNAFWDTVNYTYYTTLYRYPDLTYPVTTYYINQQNYDKIIDTASFGIGTYYAMLYLTDIGTGTTFFVDYDYADFVNGVTLSGIVFNATSGASLSGATVGVTQGGATSSYTSTLAGYATTNPLNVGQAITVDGSLAGYTPYTSTFTPLGAANITKSIPLVSTTTACYWTVAANSTSLTGLVDELPYYVPANGAYLNLSNATWYSNITLGLTGWYLFEDLENSSAYTLIAGKSGFNDYSASVTSGADNLTWYNFTLGAAFDLTVYVKDAASGAPLTSNVTIEITNSTGSSYSETTTTGSATFTDLAGSWDISAVCVGYTEGTATVNMDADKSVTISLSTPVIPNVYYTPHDVKMVVQDAYGNPIDGATMTITPISTTLDSWDWLQSVLGIPVAAAADTTVQTGTTDYMGSATYVLVKEIQYQIDIVSVADGVDDTYYLYPKDDMYIFTVGVTGGFENPVNPVTNMSWTFTNTTHNATYENLTFTYTDSGNTTTNVSFWVKSHASPVTVVYQTYCTDPNNCNVVYTAAASNGEEYYVGADITCSDGSCYNLTQAFAFQKLVNLGISSAYYPWIAAAFLIVIGAIFSVISVRFGAVLVPIFAWMFFYMKWLTLTWQQTALLTILLVIGVFAYIRKQEDKVGS